MRRTRGAPAGPPRPRSDPPQEVDRDRRTPGPLWVPYLGRFALRRGSRLFTLDGRSHPVEPARAPIFDAALLGGCDLGDLSVLVSMQAGLAPAEGFRKMRDALQRPENLLRAFPYAGPRSFDVVLVDQGYGGVWVNTVEIWKELRRRGVEALLISPVDPLFESKPESAYLFTWERVCRRHPLSYFSFINLVRNLLKLLSSGSCLSGTVRSRFTFPTSCHDSGP